MTNLKSLEISAKVHLAGVENVISMIDNIENNSLMTVEASEMKNVIKAALVLAVVAMAAAAVGGAAYLVRKNGLGE